MTFLSMTILALLIGTILPLTTILKKHELKYHFLWSRNGSVFMRENNTQQYDSEQILNNLVRTVGENSNGDVGSVIELY